VVEKEGVEDGRVGIRRANKCRMFGIRIEESRGSHPGTWNPCAPESMCVRLLSLNFFLNVNKLK
jgi:hypothetical protein